MAIIATPFMHERRKREGRRQIARMGHSASLVTKHQQQVSSHGSQWNDSPESPHSIMVIPDPGGASVDIDFRGLEAESDILFLVRDDLDEQTDGELRDGGGEDASEITFLDTMFRVESIIPYHAAGQDLLSCSEYNP